MKDRTTLRGPYDAWECQPLTGVSRSAGVDLAAAGVDRVPLRAERLYRLPVGGPGRGIGGEVVQRVAVVLLAGNVSGAGQYGSMAEESPLSGTADALDGFSPATRAWFDGAFAEPTQAQAGAW